MIIFVKVVLNRTVVDSDWCFDKCSSHLQSQSVLYHASWWCLTLVIDMIGQLSHDVIGHLSVNSWCFWLWTLQMPLVHFNLTIVTVSPTYEMTSGFKPFTVFSCVLHCRLKKRLIVMQSFPIVLHYRWTWDRLMLEIQMTDKGKNSLLQLHNHHSKVWGRRKNKWWWTLFMIPAIFTHILGSMG